MTSACILALLSLKNKMWIVKIGGEGKEARGGGEGREGMGREGMGRDGMGSEGDTFFVFFFFL